jgi:hypothetical protein
MITVDVNKLIHVKDNKYRIPYMYRGKKANKYMVKVTCSVCEKTGFKYINARNSNRSICSQECKNKIMSGENSWNWSGGRKYKRGHSGGHILKYVPDHPNARKGWVPEHRLIVEKHIGRYLLPTEFIHHINCNMQDNRIDNLIIVDRWQHNKVHNALETCVEALLQQGHLKFNSKEFKYEVIK